MSATPSNTANVQYVKVSNLDYRSNISGSDLMYIVQSGSFLKSTYCKVSDLTGLNRTGSFTGSFIGEFTGDIVGDVTGNSTGSHKGDIYSDNGTLILQNGSGGVSTSIFYGTSSYANEGQSSSYSVSSSYSISSSASISSSYSLSSSYSVSSSFSNTSSYSISSSYSNTSSYSLNSESSSYSITSSYSNKADFGQSLVTGFPYITDTLYNILSPDSNNNVVYRYDHGLGVVPSLVKVTLYVSLDWDNSGGSVPFLQGDELETSALVVDFGADNDGTPIWVHKDETSIYVVYSTRASYTIAQSAGIYKFVKPGSNNSSVAISGAGYVNGINIEWDKLKYKIYVWK